MTKCIEYYVAFGEDAPVSGNGNKSLHIWKAENFFLVKRGPFKWLSIAGEVWSGY